MKTQSNQIQLGYEVEDTITGFTGTAIARTEWLNGSARIVVQPRANQDGTLPDPEDIDEAQLQILSTGNFRPSGRLAARAGYNRSNVLPSARAARSLVAAADEDNAQAATLTPVRRRKRRAKYKKKSSY